jgi:hypothetical protein
VPQAVRLIFTYHGDRVLLDDQQPVDSVIPGMDLPREELPGRFVEVRDATGQRLSQVPIRGAMNRWAEVFPANHEDPITRVDIEPSGAFTVVVPVTPRATQVAVVNRDATAPVRAELVDGLLADDTVTDLTPSITTSELGTFALNTADLFADPPADFVDPDSESSTDQETEQ